MVAVDPYRRWRRATFFAGAAVVCLLTAASLLFLIYLLVGFFSSHSK